MKVSIIIPFFNEAKTLSQVVTAIMDLALPIEKEIILIDDGSSDNSTNSISHREGLILLRHTTNKGKGASLRTGLSCATGDVVVFQDADTEYNPTEISELISPIINNTADVVYGSRFIGKKTEHFFIHTYLANKLLSWLTKIKTGLPITDMETCYKAFRSPILKNISLTENRFGIEPEITVKIARIKKIRYTEIPISYNGRSIREGKKVRWQDGVRALWCILWY